MRYFLFINVLLLSACTSQYKALRTASGDEACLQKFVPVFAGTLYNTQVNVIGKHLSGLLLIKNMPDYSTRIVFSNEMGFSFFDFGFAPNGDFTVYSVIKQMNKKVVINTLKKDFELVLMKQMNSVKPSVQTDGTFMYFTYPGHKGNNYYVTNKSCSTLERIESGSKRKPMVEVIMKDYVAGVPDTIGITHKNFNFTIGLKRLERNVKG